MLAGFLANRTGRGPIAGEFCDLSAAKTLVKLPFNGCDFIVRSGKRTPMQWLIAASGDLVSGAATVLLGSAPKSTSPTSINEGSDPATGGGEPRLDKTSGSKLGMGSRANE